MSSPQHLDDEAKFTLGVISGKIDLVLVQMAAQRQSDEARFTKIEADLEEQADEIAGLKRDRSWLLGGAAAIGTALTGLGTWLGLK